jgi:hypothetical protein
MGNKFGSIFGKKRYRILMLGLGMIWNKNTFVNYFTIFVI